MGLLDKIFGRNAVPGKFQPTNRLEQLLVEAANRPEKRPEFYRQIFHFDLLVIGKVERKPDGGQIISLMQGGTDENPVAYVYTSADALSWHLRKAGQGPQPYVKMKAQDLLGLISGKQGVALNSGHEHGFYLPASEVRNLIEVPHSSETLSESESISLGKPAELPDELLGTLAAYKATNHAILQLRFGMMQRPGGQPEYLYVVRFKESCNQGEQERIKLDLYRLTKDAYRREVAVNFLDFGDKPDDSIWARDGVLHSI